jgi:polyphosphate kinase
MAQLKDRRLTGYLDEVFESAMDPSTRCWELGPDGTWTAQPHDGREVRDHQVWLMEKHRQG